MKGAAVKRKIAAKEKLDEFLRHTAAQRWVKACDKKTGFIDRSKGYYEKKEIGRMVRYVLFKVKEMQ